MTDKPMPHSRNLPRLDEIAEKFYSGQRLMFEDGWWLYEHATLLELARMADWVRWKKHPAPVVTYIVSRNINYTNICWVKCKFCAFYRPPGSSEGYVLPKEVLFQKIREMVDAGGIEILIQGGLNPKLKIEYYEDLFRSIKRNFKIHIHGLSAPEILYIAHLSRMTVRDTISRLRDAGLDTIPGAGGEILSDEVRMQIAPRKDTTSEWLGVHRDAHTLGMRTTATMMYGSLDKISHRLEHFLRVRELQDETGGFTAFICWNFQPGSTELGGARTSGLEYLKMVALSRIMLDNIDNIQASWVTQGAQVAQLSLRYGVNDFGSTMFEENVVRAAGASFCMDESELARQIRNAGFEPRRRNTLYEYVS
jgi:cyclic dehypoxanthinyl futalosine synthase